MAYFGRGGFSSIGGGGNPLENNNSNNGMRYHRFGRHYYIPLNNTYFLFQMITAIIIFAVAITTFFVIYKPTIIDPISNIKKYIMYSYLFINVVSIILVIIINYFSEDKYKLINRLILILTILIISILVFSFIKLNMNNTYTRGKFEQMYIQKYGEEKNDRKTKLDIGLAGVKVKTEKESYVDKCVQAYKVFSVRFYSLVGLNIMLILLLIYQIYKLMHIQEKVEQINKDDAILFDSEQNIKY